MKKNILKYTQFFFTFIFTFLLTTVFVLAQSGSNVIGNPLGNTNSLSALFSAIVSVLIQLGTIVGALAIMYGGFLFVTSGGNEEKLQKAKVTLTWAVVGIAILLGARIIFAVIEGTVKQLN